MAVTALPLFAAVHFLGQAATPAWPQFRGPSGTAIARDDRSSIVQIDPVKNLLWSAELPAGHSSPCIAGGQAIVTGYDREKRVLEVISLDARTGVVVWRQALPADEVEAVHEVSNPATATPATDGGTVVVYFGSKGLFAFDFEGKEIWRHPLPMAKTPRGFGSGTSPVLSDDRVLLDVQLGDESYLGAWELVTGKLVWKAPRLLYNRGWATPVTWTEGEKWRVGMAAAGRFIAYDLADGKEVWWVDGLAQQVCATPAIDAGVLFISTAGVLGERENISVPLPFADAVKAYDRDGDGKISFDEIPEDLLFANRHTSDGAGNMTIRQMLKFGGDKEIPPMNQEAWEEMRNGCTKFKESGLNKTSLMAVRLGGEGDVSEGGIMWQENRGVPEVPSPLVYRGRVWLIRNGGILACRDAASGREFYEERIGAPGGYYASPVAAGGRIYLASDRGMLTVVEAADEFRVLARNDLGEGIYATPAVVEGQLFVRTTRSLVAFAASKPTTDIQQASR